MKARGIRGGILLALEPDDTAETIAEALAANRELLEGKVSLEVGGKMPVDLLAVVREQVEAAGGTLRDIRPPTAVMQTRGETKIIAKTIRSGARIESSGGVVILGDVNAGAEIVADGDVIVVGTLRGIAHAGASGDPNAVIWARRILSPQLRIGSALAQAGEQQGDNGGDRPEVAHLKDGQIVLRPWG